MLAVQAGSDAELERRGTLVSAASSSDGTLRSAERSANADGNHTGIFRRVFFFFPFSLFLFSDPVLFGSPLDSSRRLSKKKERIERKMGSSSRKTKKKKKMGT